MPAVLKELMRHESIETTMKYYVDLDADEMADVKARGGAVEADIASYDAVRCRRIERVGIRALMNVTPLVQDFEEIGFKCCHKLCF